MKNFAWPLSDSNFTWLDRLKICKFFLDPSRQWTEGAEVRKFQRVWAEYTGAKYCVMTSSGSTANTLVAEYLKDQNKNTGKNVIVTQPVGWMTSYSPFIREGFKMKFIDVTLKDLSMDLDKLEKYLKRNHKEVAAVFVISILGFAPDIKRLKMIEKKYNVKICLDNCESSNSSVNSESINAHFTSTTSLYFSHIHTTGTESGFIFTNSKEEFEYFLLGHHNGLVRVLEPYVYADYTSDINTLYPDSVDDKFNPNLKDSRFDFYQLGNNYRSSDVNAFIGGLDFARNKEYSKKRWDLYQTFITTLNPFKYKKVWHQEGDVPFAIPIIIQGNSIEEKTKYLEKAFKLCDRLGIEYRSLVSGNILRQTAFQHLGAAKKYPFAEELHNFAFYIGLNPKLERVRVMHFAIELNKL